MCAVVAVNVAASCYKKWHSIHIFSTKTLLLSRNADNHFSTSLFISISKLFIVVTLGCCVLSPFLGSSVIAFRIHFFCSVEHNECLTQFFSFPLTLSRHLHCLLLQYTILSLVLRCCCCVLFCATETFHHFGCMVGVSADGAWFCHQIIS